ncbi:MAG TPA: DinB family protein [Pseudonocardiaceae bacterium]|nr:DinB family protein [Pseudonocardiaceae bacterium]
MPMIPESNYSPKWSGERPTLPLTGDERSTLIAFLDWHRATFELKCSGVAEDRLSDKSIEPSNLSMHGILRHLTGCERWWFGMQFAGEDLPMLYYSDDDPDQDFDSLDGDFGEALAAWRAECDRSRTIVAGVSTLEQTGTRFRDGAAFSLRYLLVQMIAEYARHNGHADLLRERIDGAAGV